MTNILQDIRYAVLSLALLPAFTAIAVTTLALGIGANTAIFTLVNGLLYHAVPGVEDTETLVLLGRTQGGAGFDSFNWLDYQDFIEQNRSFEDLVAFTHDDMTVRAGERVARVRTGMVAGNYFTALGTSMTAGRPLVPEDSAVPGHGSVCVIASALATRIFGDQASAVGQTLTISGQPITVAGVSAPGFRGTNRLTNLEIWVPISMQPVIMPFDVDFFADRRAVWFRMFGRLRPGVTPIQAEIDIRGIASRLEASYPETNEGRGITLAEEIDLTPGYRRDFRTFGILLMAIVLLVLLIASGNVANLLLVRATGRLRDMAVRLALGSGRTRLVQQHLAESMVLALLGGAAGLLMAVWGTGLLHLIVRLTPIAYAADVLHLAPDGRVLLFTFTVSVLSGMVFGIAPALASTRGDLTVSLKDGPQRPRPGSSRLRSVLVSGQLAISLVLLMGSGLFIRSLDNLKDLDPGFDADRVAVLDLSLDAQSTSQERGKAFFEEVLRSVRALPGIEAVSLCQQVPLELGRWDTRIQVPGVEPPEGMDGTPVEYRVVTPDYFRTMGIPILRGGTLSGEDVRGGAWEIVVNRTAAERLWPGEEAVGKIVRWQREYNVWVDARVVGVSEDAAYGSLSTPPHPHIYVPFSMVYQRTMTLHVRSVDPLSVARPVRDSVGGVDPNVPVLGIRTLQQQLDLSIGQQRAAATISAVFALLALTLAALGLYGALSWHVRQRTHEIGVRIALGAPASGVVRLVVRQGMMLVLISTVVGLLAANVVSRLLAGSLHEVSPSDPLTQIVTVTVLVGVGFLAAWFPARRATRIDPMTALRYE